MVPNDADWKLFFFWPGENWLLPKYPGEWSLVPSSLGKQWDLIIGELQWPGYCNRYVRCILLLSGWWKECDNLFRQAVDPHKDTIVKGNKSLNLVWFKWGSQWWIFSICCSLPLVEWLLSQWGILKNAITPFRVAQMTWIFGSIPKLVTFLRSEE